MYARCFPSAQLSKYPRPIAPALSCHIECASAWFAHHADQDKACNDEVYMMGVPGESQSHDLQMGVAGILHDCNVCRDYKDSHRVFGQQWNRNIQGSQYGLANNNVLHRERY